MGKKSRFTADVLHGSLEMLILRTLAREPAHGYGIARRLEQISGDVLQVGESSLYPALQRLLVHGWVKAAWRESESGRQARVYRITPAGRKRLAEESAAFTRLVGAITTILQTG